MHINSISPICSPNQKNINSNITFSGISEETIDKFSLNDEKSVQKFVDIIGEEFRKMQQKWHEKKASISGWFQRRRTESLSEQETVEMKRFLKDQQLIIATMRERNMYAAQCADALRAAGKAEKEKITLDRRLLKMEKAQQRATANMEELWKSRNKTSGFDSIGGYLQEKCILNEEFIQKLLLEGAGEDIDVPNAILFFGPTGCGKTSFAKALAGEAKCLFDKIGTRPAPTADEFIMNCWNELEEKAMKAEENFKKSGVRTILLIDDLDILFGKNSPIIGDLNAFMQNCSKDYHTTLFITTNNPLKIPSATRNNRRMPIKVSLDAPDKTDIAEILQLYLQGGSKNKLNIDYNAVAEILTKKVDGASYACSQIQDICQNVIMQGKSTIKKEDILEQARKVQRGISKKQMDKFKDEAKQLNVIGGRL